MDPATGKLTAFQDEPAQFVPQGQVPKPAPPPDPALLAATATKMLKLPALQPQLGPGADKAVVHKPLWLWVDDPGVLTSSLSLRGVTVTVNARITKTTWHTGEPIQRPGSLDREEAIVTCDGPGQPPPPAASLPADALNWKPACGYAYHWKSTPKRTNGTGTWQVSVTTEWTADWTSNVGPHGAIVMDMTSNTTINVLELRSVLVNDPNATVTPSCRPSGVNGC